VIRIVLRSKERELMGVVVEDMPRRGMRMLWKSTRNLTSTTGISGEISDLFLKTHLRTRKP